jgi:hypothetical protein
MLRPVAVGVVLVLASTAAEAADIPCSPVEAGVIHVDGLLQDWDGVEAIEVGGRSADLSFTVRCNYDAKALYLAIDVRDDYLARTKDAHPAEDHVELAFSDGRKIDRLVIYPSDPARGVRRVARWSSGRGLAGVELADARLATGWTVEARLARASVPGFVPDAQLLRAAIAVSDCDSKARPAAKSRLGTAPTGGADSLGAIVFPQASSSLDAFLRDRKLAASELWFDRPARSGGGSVRAVVGPGLVAFVSDEYAWLALPLRERKDLLDARLVDLAGDGREALVIRYVERAANGSREVLAAFRPGGEGLRRAFGVETGKAQGANRLATRVSFVKRGRATDLLIEALPATGWTQASYREQRDAELAPLPTPWDTPPRARFQFKGDLYSRSE